MFKIIGIVAVVVLGILLVAALGIWIWWRKMTGGIASLAMDGDVELVENPNPKWIRKPEVETAAKELSALGFEPIVVYKKVLMSIEPYFFGDAERKKFAAIYRTPLGVKREFSAETEQGINICVNDDEYADTYAVQQNKHIEPMHGSSLDEMHARFLELLGDAPLRTIADEDLADEVAAQIKREVNSAETFDRALPLWEDSKDEFIRKWSAHLKEKTVRKNFRYAVQDSLARLDNMADDALSESEGISAKQLSLYGCSFLICNPRISKEGYALYLKEKFYFLATEELKHVAEFIEQSPDSLTGLQSVAKAHPELGLIKLITITEPVEMDIYGFTDPDEEDEEDGYDE